MSVPYAFTAVTSATGSQLDADFAACAQLDVLATTAGAPLVGFKQAGAATVLSDVQTKLRQIVSVFDYFTPSQIADVIAGTLTLDVTTPLVNANTSGFGLLFPAGQYKISGSPTFTVPCTFQYGAILNVATAQTVTFNHQLSAGVNQIFSLAGTAVVVINPNHTTTGYPEWWGAVTGGPDCLAAISASIIAMKITQLMPAVYVVSSALHHNTPHHTLQGFDDMWGASNTGSTAKTVIELVNNSGIILQLGPGSLPGGGINTFPDGIVIRNLELVRLAQPLATDPANSGLLAQWVLGCLIENVKSTDSLIGFQSYGCVQMRYVRCHAFRALVATGGTDYWYGFYANGGASGIGASGSNASLYFDRCLAGRGAGGGTNSSGFYINLSWADVYVTEPEVSNCDVGINIQGSGSSVYDYTEVDLHIIKPIIDGYTFAGIYISSTSRYGSVSIIGGYSAPTAGATPTASIYVQNSVGCVSITGGFQHILGTAVCSGLVISGSSQVTSIGNNYIECRSYPVDIGTSADCAIADRVSNWNNTASAVLRTTSSSRLKLDMCCSGAANKISLGYQAFSILNYYCEFNCTGLNPAPIYGGSANKLVINGVQIVAVGPTGTNYASGVMA